MNHKDIPFLTSCPSPAFLGGMDYTEKACVLFRSHYPTQILMVFLVCDRAYPTV